ncbi:DUF6979 family protein [Candidatus Nitrotoga sp. M5]|uniref:DUF6979 family protein n=1 Tax=Candidatus Nitrotoga sp. M5 TaxID=2890409 RepID=UPI001EF4872B|nr:hypothetical protein [Candidatus Nitrotoga sp. M5]CAH1388095.1 conserved hypothetical protein [Candidatus Nitrotoga sp. M5]
MSKYGTAAIQAANLARKGVQPRSAWGQAVSAQFLSQKSSQDKGCPRDTFLSLAEEGYIRGVGPGKYTRSKKNRSYAMKAIEILKSEPSIVERPLELWNLILQGEVKTHNEQMYVIASLWRNGDITT